MDNVIINEETIMDFFKRPYVIDMSVQYFTDGRLPQYDIFIVRNKISVYELVSIVSGLARSELNYNLTISNVRT